MDSRIEKLANGLVNYSCRVQAGEKVLIEAIGTPDDVVRALVKEVYKAGGTPFVNILNPRVNRELLLGMTEEAAKFKRDADIAFMKRMDAYIAIRGGGNSYEKSDVPSEITAMYDRIMRAVVDERVNNTKWVILRWPTEGMSQLARTSTEAYEKFFFDVCTMDYAKMDRAMDALKDLIDRTDKVRLVGPRDTDISFSIKGVGGKKCSGECNIPDGEVYTAPVKNSVNGVIRYNTPSIEKDIEFSDVRLVVKDGKIVEATSNRTEDLNAILDTDGGSRYFGEFALGVNPFIEEPIGDILFDEKISGSIHMTPGCCYEDVSNGNKSAIHWDLVMIQTEKYGGGEIWFDGRLIRKNGLFVLPELQALNPENLR